MEDFATMQAKAQAWLGNLLDWGKSRQRSNAEKLYSEAIRLARKPVFFQKYSVVDNVDGRFDVLSLIVILLMRRLKPIGDEGKALSQELFDSMFADMDLSLREMGAGDTGVSKRVRVMAEAFMGRLDSYIKAIDKKDKKRLSSALQRNLFRGKKTIDPLANGLVDYLLTLIDQFDHLPEEALLAGRVAVT